MVVRTRVGEYFGLSDPSGILTENWDELPAEQPVVLHKFQPFFGCGKPELQVVSKKFRRDSLTLIKEEQFPSKECVLQLFTSQKEDDMSTSSNLIAAARINKEAVQSAIKTEVGRAIERALWVAQKDDEFAAIPVLEDLKAEYCGGTVKTNAALTEKDGKVVKLSRTEKVDERVWSAILKKVSKIGGVTKSTPNKAECIIDKKEVENFTKAAKAVAGITVE